MTYLIRRNPWKTCPRCKQDVYKSRWHDHDRRCLLAAAHFGPPEALAARFRADATLTPALIAREVAQVGAEFITGYLHAGGITYEELRTRLAPAVRRVPRRALRHCRRCDVLLDARSVRPASADATLCAWCADELHLAALAGAGQPA